MQEKMVKINNFGFVKEIRPNASHSGVTFVHTVDRNFVFRNICNFSHTVHGCKCMKCAKKNQIISILFRNTFN